MCHIIQFDLIITGDDLYYRHQFPPTAATFVFTLLINMPKLSIVALFKGKKDSRR